MALNMFLFLMGLGLPELLVILLLLFGFGLLISWLIRILLRKVWKDASDRKIKLLSRFSAVILSPTIVIGSLALFIYLSMEHESEEDRVRSHYEMMEGEIREDLKTGMSKKEVVERFGETDTTKSILVYDLSLQEAEEKYILEITFDEDGLKEFKRQH